MATSAHLWAVGYDDKDGIKHAQEVVTSLGSQERSLRLLEIAVLARSPDGTLLFNGKPFLSGNQVAHLGTMGLLTGFALAVPLLTDTAVGRMFDSSTPALSEALGIDDKFKQDIASLLQTGTFALLVLDVAQNMDAILPHLRGLGGRVLKTNVDIERANLIQSTLAEKLTS